MQTAPLDCIEPIGGPVRTNEVLIQLTNLSSFGSLLRSVNEPSERDFNDLYIMYINSRL